jgi:hypothetical protein
MREAQLFVANLLGDRNGLVWALALNSDSSPSERPANGPHIPPARACSTFTATEPMLQKRLSALSVTETCSPAPGELQNSPLVTHTVHGIPMHTRRENVVTHVASRIQASGGEVRTSNWFFSSFFFRGTPLLTSHPISSQVKTSNGMVPEAIGEATSSSNACVSWELSIALQRNVRRNPSLPKRLKWPMFEIKVAPLADRDVQNASNVVGLPRLAVSVKNTSYAGRLTFSMTGTTWKILAISMTPWFGAKQDKSALLINRGEGKAHDLPETPPQTPVPPRRRSFILEGSWIWLARLIQPKATFVQGSLLSLF